MLIHFGGKFINAEELESDASLTFAWLPEFSCAIPSQLHPPRYASRDSGRCFLFGPAGTGVGLSRLLLVNDFNCLGVRTDVYHNND